MVYFLFFFFGGLGLISPYSFELGFGLVCWLGLMSPCLLELGLSLMVVPWLWRLSGGLIVSISVCYCGQFADKRSLHVVWYDWSMMLKRASVILAVGYAALLRLSKLSLEACGRKVWLGVGPVWFMDVINNDGPVTIDLGMNMYRGTVATIGHSIAL